jgi:peptidyl-prolyl cis-trans isomerase B (cyclophilin B)
MPPKQWNTPPAMQIDTEKTFQAKMETSRGTVDLSLDPKSAPTAVNNFVFLAREGFYDNLVFHRVIPNFMVQGGDPTGTGRGGPGYRFNDEFGADELKHEKGVISLANAGPNTNGSQFFITHLPQPHLDGHHKVFGRVTSGQDVVDTIQQNDTLSSVTIIEE